MSDADLCPRCGLRPEWMGDCAISPLLGMERDRVIEMVRKIDGTFNLARWAGRTEDIVDLVGKCPLLRDSLLPLAKMEDFEW